MRLPINLHALETRRFKFFGSLLWHHLNVTRKFPAPRMGRSSLFLFLQACLGGCLASSSTFFAESPGWNGAARFYSSLAGANCRIHTAYLQDAETRIRVKLLRGNFAGRYCSWQHLGDLVARHGQQNGRRQLGQLVGRQHCDDGAHDVRLDVRRSFAVGQPARRACTRPL